ncbi:hypothetical protein Mal64_06980 [Pseudobythopirellula maris]|uniref:PEP-CTERM protein-sorting domain-containing protein n=1 Tax=Pseudobythopirellula maris TaxID=2527991 RepID=A0A5C5ZVQ6_9BACT|nr:hypothetical protein [Pseudobythopirellula maris]TWT90313.1 hypothetical protein Mal64_06980 [Pseudobythopirellula maris]
MFRLIRTATCLVLLGTPYAGAVDLESFEFNDANDTPLTAAVNTANPGNFWFYDEEATSPDDETTGDISAVQSGAYQIVTDSAFATGLESRFLDIANVSSGQVYLSATFSDWNFSEYDGETTEEFRLSFLEDDSGTSGSTVTAQVRINRNPDTGAMELLGEAIGTAGSHDIANVVELPDTLSEDFTVVLALDKDSDSFEIFYKQGSAASQVLGLGGVSRVRDGNSVRMVTGDFGVENFLPFLIDEFIDLDRVVLSDTNPLTDLVTLEVDRETGAMTLKNTSGAAVPGVTGVTLESEVGAIDLTDFADFSGTLADGQMVALDSSPDGAPGLWVQNPVEDVRAELTLSGGGVRTLDVSFIENGGDKWRAGDLNFDGVIDSGDYAILAANAEATLTGSLAEQYQLGDLNSDGLNDAADFGIFKADYIAANGEVAFARLVSGVPEPGSAALAALGMLALGIRRRRDARILTETHTSKSSTMTRSTRSTPAVTLAVLAVAALAAGRAEAVIFEDFQFNDTAGTAVEGAANSANSGNLLDADGDSIGVVTNGLGQLDLSGKDNDLFGTHFVDIDPAFTSGTIFGVMELTWDFQSVLDTTQNEELRITFENNDPRGTETTAEFQIIRDDSDQMVALGQANGTGSTDFSNPVPLIDVGLTQNAKFIAVLKADLDNREYELLYSSNGGSSFNSAGIASLSPSRNIEAVRLGINNDFVGDNVLIDRFFVADELPYEIDPDKLTLMVHPQSGYTAIVNETGTPFEIDHYRILSDDGSLLVDGWRSLQDQAIDAVDGPDGGSIAGDGVGETWTEAGGSDSGVLSESFLLSGTAFDSGVLHTLGTIVDPDDIGSLTFEYRDASTGTVFTGDVSLDSLGLGDYNLDGVVDAADFTVWRDDAFGAFGAPGVTAYYDEWVDNYGASYAAAPLAVSVPEPGAMVMVLLLLAVPALRRRVG